MSGLTRAPRRSRTRGGSVEDLPDYTPIPRPAMASSSGIRPAPSPWSEGDFLSDYDDEAKSGVAGIFGAAGFFAIDLGDLSSGGAMQQVGGPLAGVNLIRLEA